MPSAEEEVLEITRQMLDAMYTANPEVHRQHSAEDVSSYEWYIAPQRIDGLEFHLGLIEGGGNGEPSRLDMLTPRVQVLWGYGDCLLHAAENDADRDRTASVQHHERDAGLCEAGRRLEDGASA